MKKIALIIRGKHSDTHRPWVWDQHADVILSDGAPTGFFSREAGFMGTGASGMFMDAMVFDYETYLKRRKHYVDIEEARQKKVISTLCTLVVEEDVAKKFDEFWRNLHVKATAGSVRFSIVGNNCSTRAAEAFRYAGVLDRNIKGIDTPNRLFSELRSRYGETFQCSSGYIGFSPVMGKYELKIEKP